MITNRLGVCCITLGQKSDFKTLQLNRTKTLSDKQDKIFSVWKHNLSELNKVLSYLLSKNILHYRISSNMFPLADHVDFQHYWEEFCNDESHWLTSRKIVKYYLDNNGRLSTHPDQFCIISSGKPDVNTNGRRNLEYHAKMFDMLHIPQNHFCPINIHISNGNAPEIGISQVDHNLSLLSSSVFSRLVFETEDKSFWTYQNINKYFPQIPITLDYHHRLINNQEETEEEAHDVCVSTWGSTKPLFHHSEGKEHKLDRAHSDFVSSIPICATDVDIEIEAKQKDLAVLRILCQSL
jgi:UV DNA damage endonuclease